jgi:signal transduction histidine kinase
MRLVMVANTRPTETLRWPGSERGAGYDEKIAIVVHELRSPLAAISNAVVRCRHEASPHTLEHMFDMIERQVTKALCLVDDLIDLSRAGRAITQTTVDLRQVIDSAAEEMEHQIGACGQILQQEVPSQPVPVRGDALRLQQVVVNLLANASKYSPTGTAINLSLQRSVGAIELRVRDSGCGIEPGDLQRIFEPFFQATGAAGATERGLGLGLALARRFVELHGGKIEAHSRGHGLGSEFVVRLPLHSDRENDES